MKEFDSKKNKYFPIDIDISRKQLVLYKLKSDPVMNYDQKDREKFQRSIIDQSVENEIDERLLLSK